MLGRIARIAKQVAYYLFWGYVVLLHVAFVMVVMGLLGGFVFVPV